MFSCEALAFHSDFSCIVERQVGYIKGVKAAVFTLKGPFFQHLKHLHTRILEMSALVFDNGSGFIKAGVAGDDAPKLIFPTVVGATPDKKDHFVGCKAQSKRELLSLTHPIERGRITHWDDIEKVCKKRNLHVAEPDM